MINLLGKRLVVTPLFVLSLLICLSAQGETAEVTMAKVTIVVDGMMKSKSGAT